MRRKRLVTAVLCAILAAASCSVSNISDKSIVYAANAKNNQYNETISVIEKFKLPSETLPDTEKVTEQSKTAPDMGKTTMPSQTESRTEQPPAPGKMETGAEKPTVSSGTVSDTKLPPAAGETEKNTEHPTVPSDTEMSTEHPMVPSESETGTEHPTVPSESETGTEHPTVPNESETGTEHPTLPSESETGTEHPILPSESETGTEHPTLPSESETGTEQPILPNEPESGTEQPTIPSETEIGTEFAGETGMTDESEWSETETGERESESELLTEKEQGSKKDEKESESETETESETERRGSNEELIRNQNIVRPDDIVLEFRFTQVDPEYAIVQLKEGISIYESRSEEARVIGKLNYYGICSILEESEDGWYYIESGSVRGFAKAEAFVRDEVAERIVRVKGLEKLPLANRLVSCMSNKAYAYTHTTTQEVLAEKVYAVAKEETKIFEARKKDADAVGILPEGALCYILADSEKDWIFVESGDVRGFVQKEALLKGKKAKKRVQETGEENMQLAEEKISPEDNRACYYTLTSTKKASVSAKLREDIVNFALDYLGNPYVWGGTSLTSGADCSGFVQSVYANFGYYLPRVAETQSVYGMQIPIESAAPGDLIFYARDGYVYHVSMYIGNGQVVHAAGRKVGIITSGITGNAVWATRIITD